MTKKHYETIAAALHQRLIFAETDRQAANLRVENALIGSSELVDAVNAARDCASRVNEITDVARDLCREFAKENPRFDGDKFRAACGLEV